MIKLNVNEYEQEANQKHDEGYKGILAKKTHFLHFLKKYIAADWTDKIDPDKMERIDKSFITQEYRKQDSDLIYKLQVNGEDVYFYVLMELQSSVDFTMPFRLLRYMVELLNDIFKNTKEEIRERKGFKLPAVVPIILYNGEDNWTAVRSYKEYTDNHEFFGENIINFSYLLFDLNRTEDETIVAEQKLLDIIFALNKIRPSSEANVKEKYSETIKLLEKSAVNLNADEAVELRNWTKYVHFRGNVPVGFEDEFKQAISKGEVNTMTHSLEIMIDMLKKEYKQEGRQEGIQKGIQKGKQEGIIEMAIEMIKQGATFDFVKSVSKLTDEELNHLYSV
ncbi:MAG: Rpn family recombination-promoting nuclease/putative transposase [Oscillospiraceae bacterium]|nr:Rpn family recombination-promoting nuclease/putative transposase [Oscillospiraceae bacterium]